MTVSPGTRTRWVPVCALADLIEDAGVRALVEERQVALFRVSGEPIPYALDAADPFCGAAVLSRGIVGDVSGKLVVASPMYRHHFCLASGVCLEDGGVRLQTYPVRVISGQVQLGVEPS